jgi:hypothetical protein
LLCQNCATKVEQKCERAQRKVYQIAMICPKPTSLDSTPKSAVG